MANASDRGGSVYVSPMAVGPTLKELADISIELNLGLEADDALLEEYQSILNDSVKSMNQLNDLAEPSLPVKYPRTQGYRPRKEDNPHNAWCYRCNIKGTDEGKLSGKRIAIKDSIAIAGIPMTVGFNGLEGFVPDFDATVVTWVLDEGGTILGKSTCEELCCSANSHTSGTGLVTNPIKPGHCAGGSSSGSAVLVAINEVDMAIGGDQGGSVRIPCSWCGLVGLKPTYGLVPYTGAVSGEFVFDHLGPMAKTVKDCALLLEVISGYDNGNDARQPRDLKIQSYSLKLEDIDLASIRIAVLKEGFDHPVSDPEVDNLIHETISGFASSAEAHVQEVSIPLHKSSTSFGSVIGRIGEVDTVLNTAGSGLSHTGYYPSNMMRDVGARLKKNAKDLHPYNKAQLLHGAFLKKKYCYMYGKAQNLMRQLEWDFDHVLAEYDVVAMPTVPFTAPPMVKSDASIKEIVRIGSNIGGNLKSGNLTGHPSITINAGTVGGLPVGLLLTGKKFDELRLLQIAHAFEKCINGTTK
ncbi:amidase-like [Lytechinus variegatus]|uniref:amidase-like n=1 Tax=Lytechinus variegatus TaxID=7654 RepID=UPI001BB136F2|nr:amidase-like [Lytechinus variegatus]